MKTRILTAFLFLLSLAGQQSKAQTNGSLWVAYSCEASDIIEFSSGDRKLEIMAPQLQVVLKEPENVNLVIGSHEFLLRPHVGKSAGTFEISLMQKFFGEGYRVIETRPLRQAESN